MYLPYQAKHVESVVYYTKNLDSIYKEIKSCQKATEFMNDFKDKVIYNLKSKPIQDLKSFLKNFENLMTQHKKKKMKALKIDVIEQNYEYLLTLILYVLHEEYAFECQIIYALKQLKIETFEQIKDSLIIKSASAELEEEKEEPIKLDQVNYVECIKITIQKVMNKLSKSKKPQTSKALIKDIENQISNIKSNKKTTVKIKEILESNKDFPSKILNILDELDLIYIHKNDSKVASIEYYENLAERYEESTKDGKLDKIITRIML